MSNHKGPANDAIRLDSLESRARIADLVHRYANHIVCGEFQQCRLLFAPEATFETRQMNAGDPSSVRTISRLEGIEAILDYVARSASSVCPMIHNLVIDISGDEAMSSSVMAATAWASGQVIVGQYRDTYRRYAEWCFTSRTYTMFREPASATRRI